MRWTPPAEFAQAFAQALADGLASPDHDVRQQAAEAMAAQVPDALELALPLLLNRDETATAAVEALMRSGRPELYRRAREHLEAHLASAGQLAQLSARVRGVARKADAGSTAAYTLLRLPWEVKDIFRAWLEAHFPLKAAHVMSRVRDMRGGRENDPSFGSRMHGQGEFGELLRQRYRKGAARFGLDKPFPDLDCDRFVPPSPVGQGNLF